MKHTLLINNSCCEKEIPKKLRRGFFRVEPSSKEELEINFFFDTFRYIFFFGDDSFRTPSQENQTREAFNFDAHQNVQLDIKNLEDVYLLSCS